MWRTETRKRVTKRETKKSRLVSLPVCGKVCWESRCLWFRQVSNSGNSQINSQEFKESKSWQLKQWMIDFLFTLCHWFSLIYAWLCWIFGVSLLRPRFFFHLLPRTLHFGGRFLCCSACMVVFNDGPPGAGWKVTSSHIPMILGRNGRGWKGMEPRAMQANVESLGSKCTVAMMPSRRWDVFI